MAHNVKPVRPVLVGDHPLLTGAVRVWPFAEGAGSVRELLAGAVGTPTNSPTWGISPYGPCRTYVGGSTQYDDLGNFTELANVAKFSLAVLVRRTAAGNGFYCLQGTSSTNRTGIHLFTDGTTNFLLGNGTNAHGTATITYNDTNWYLLTMVYDGGGSGNTGKLKAYVWGVPETLDYQTTTIPATSANVAASFYSGRDQGGSNVGTGSCAGVWTWNRPLTDLEVLEHAGDVFGMFTPPPFRKSIVLGKGMLGPILPPTANPSNLSPADASTRQGWGPMISIDWTPSNPSNPVTGITIVLNGVSQTVTTSSLGGGAYRGVTGIVPAKHGTTNMVESVVTTQDGRTSYKMWTFATRHMNPLTVLTDEYVRGYQPLIATSTDYAIRQLLPTTVLTDYAARDTGILGVSGYELTDYAPKDIVTGLLNSLAETTDVNVVVEVKAPLLPVGANIGEFHQGPMPIGANVQGTVRQPAYFGTAIAGVVHADLFAAGANIGDIRKASLLAIGCLVAQPHWNTLPIGARIDPVFANALMEFVVKSTALQLQEEAEE